MSSSNKETGGSRTMFGRDRKANKPPLPEVFKKSLKKPHLKDSVSTQAFVDITVLRVAADTGKFLGIIRPEASLYLEIVHGSIEKSESGEAFQKIIQKRQIIPLSYTKCTKSNPAAFDLNVIKNFITPRYAMDKYTSVVLLGSGLEIGERLAFHIPTVTGECYFELTPMGDITLHRVPKGLTCAIDTFGSVASAKNAQPWRSNQLDITAVNIQLKTKAEFEQQIRLGGGNGIWQIGNQFAAKGQFLLDFSDPRLSSIANCENTIAFVKITLKKVTARLLSSLGITNSMAAYYVEVQQGLKEVDNVALRGDFHKNPSMDIQNLTHFWVPKNPILHTKSVVLCDPYLKNKLEATIHTAQGDCCFTLTPDGKIAIQKVPYLDFQVESEEHILVSESFNCRRVMLEAPDVCNPHLVAAEECIIKRIPGQLLANGQTLENQFIANHHIFLWGERNHYINRNEMVGREIYFKGESFCHVAGALKAHHLHIKAANLKLLAKTLAKQHIHLYGGGGTWEIGREVHAKETINMHFDIPSLKKSLEKEPLLITVHLTKIQDEKICLALTYGQRHTGDLLQKTVINLDKLHESIQIFINTPRGECLLKLLRGGKVELYRAPEYANLEINSFTHIDIRSLPKGGRFLLVTPEDISFEKSKIESQGDLYCRANYINRYKTMMQIGSCDIKPYHKVCIVNNDNGKLKVLGSYIADVTYYSNEDGVVEAGDKSDIKAKNGVHNINGLISAASENKIFSEGFIHNRDGKIVATGAMGKVKVQSDAAIRSEMMGVIAGNASTEIKSAQFYGDEFQLLKPVLKFDAKSLHQAHHILLEVDKLHVEAPLVHTTVEVLSKANKKEAKAVLLDGLCARQLILNVPAATDYKSIKADSFELIYPDLWACQSTPAKLFNIKREMSVLAKGISLETPLLINENVSLQTITEQPQNQIHIKAALQTKTGNILLKAYGLTQSAQGAIGSQSETSRINFQVKHLDLQGVCGPKGNFETGILETWHFKPAMFQGEVGWHLKLNFSDHYRFIEPIDVQYLHLEAYTRLPLNQIQLEFPNDVIARRGILHLQAKQCQVQVGSHHNAGLKQMNARDLLKIEAGRIQVPFGALVGHSLQLTSETGMSLGHLNYPNQTPHLKTTGGDCKIELKEMLTSYYTHFDIAHHFNLAAPHGWDDVANQIYIRCKSVLDTPWNAHRILTVTNRYSNRIVSLGNIHAYSDVKVIRTTAASAAPIYMTTYLETTGETRVIGGHFYYRQQLKGKVPIVDNFYETHYESGQLLDGHEDKKKCTWKDYHRPLPENNKPHLASIGFTKAEYKQLKIQLPGNYRGDELHLLEFQDALIGTLENIELGKYRVFNPVIDLVATVGPNAALVEAGPKATTIFMNILELNPRFCNLPKVVLKSDGLHFSELPSIYPYSEENKMIGAAFLKNIGQFPPEFNMEQLNLAKLQHWLMQNAIEWMKKNNADSHSIVSWLNNPKLPLLPFEKPLLIFQEIEYMRSNASSAMAGKPMLVFPEHYRRLWLQPGGSLMTEVLTMIGAKGAHLHISHPVSGIKELTAEVDSLTLETRPYTYQEVVTHVEKNKKLFKSKVKTTHETMTHAKVQQIASLSTEGKLKVVARALNQVGSTIQGGKEQTQLQIGYHSARPVYEKSSQSYHDRKKTWMSSKSVSGAVQKVDTVIHPKILSLGDIEAKIGEGNYQGLHVASELGNIHFVYQIGVKIYSDVINQKLPPVLSKQKQLLAVRQTTLQYGITSIFKALAGKILLESAGEYHSKGTQYLAQSKIEIQGKSIQEEPQLLQQKSEAHTSGFQGFSHHIINQTQRLQTMMRSTFVTSPTGEVKIASHRGENTLIAPDIHTGKLTLAAEGGHVNVLSQPLSQENITESRSHGLKFAGSEALEAVIQHDFSAAAHALLRMFPLFGSMEGMLNAEDTADQVGEGVKTAYYLYKLYQTLQQGKGLANAILDQIDTTVKIRFGREHIEEKTEDIQLAWLGARAIVMQSTEAVNLKGIESDAEWLAVQADGPINIEGVPQHSTQTKQSKGFSVGVDPMKKTPYLGMDLSHAEGEAKRMIATRFSHLKHLFLDGQEIHIRSAVQIETQHAVLRTEKLSIAETADSEHSHHKGFSMDTALNLGVHSGTQKGGIINQPTQLNISHTLHADIKQGLQMQGGQLSLLSQAKPLLVQTENGQLEPRYEHFIPNDGDCAFTALGIHRHKKPNTSTFTLEDLIFRADDLSLRQLVAPEIYSAFISMELPWQRNPNLILRQDKLKFYMLVSLYQMQQPFEVDLKKYTESKEVFMDFIELEYMGNQGMPEHWLSYLQKSTSILDALAKINNVNLIIWKKVLQNIQKVHTFESGPHCRTIEMYHTWDVPASLGKTYPVNSENHFNLLTPRPGLIHTQTTSHEDLVHESAERAQGIQAGLSNLGMTDAHIKSSHQTQITRATIAGPIELVAAQNSKPNSDLSQYQEVTTDKTHVRVVMPHEWAKKLVENKSPVKDNKKPEKAFSEHVEENKQGIDDVVTVSSNSTIKNKRSTSSNKVEKDLEELIYQEAKLRLFGANEKKLRQFIHNEIQKYPDPVSRQEFIQSLEGASLQANQYLADRTPGYRKAFIPLAIGAKEMALFITGVAYVAVNCYKNSLSVKHSEQIVQEIGYEPGEYHEADLGNRPTGFIPLSQNKGSNEYDNPSTTESDILTGKNEFPLFNDLKNNAPGFLPMFRKSADGGDKIKQSEAGKNRKANIAKGIPESVLGPSGKPKIHEVELSSRKRAEDSAKSRSQRGQKPEHHPNPLDGRRPHFHPGGGNSREHHTYPKKGYPTLKKKE